MCTKTRKKPHRPPLETKLLNTQHQYQGKHTWLKRKKQEIQSLKTNLYYTTLPFEQLHDCSKTQSNSIAFSLVSPAAVVLCSDNTNSEHHWAPHHSQGATARGVPCHPSLGDALRGSIPPRQKGIKLSRHIIAWLRLSQLRIHFHRQVSSASSSSMTN